MISTALAMLVSSVLLSTDGDVTVGVTETHATSCQEVVFNSPLTQFWADPSSGFVPLLLSSTANGWSLHGFGPDWNQELTNAVVTYAWTSVSNMSETETIPHDSYSSTASYPLKVWEEEGPENPDPAVDWSTQYETLMDGFVGVNVDVSAGTVNPKTFSAFRIKRYETVGVQTFLHDTLGIARRRLILNTIDWSETKYVRVPIGSELE